MSGPFITDPKVIVGWTFKYSCLLKQRGATRLHLVWDGLKPWSFSSGYAMDIGRSVAGGVDARAKLPCRTYQRLEVDLHELTEEQIRRELHIPEADAILVCSETLIRQYLVGTEDWLGQAITEEAIAVYDAHAERADIETNPTRHFGDIVSTNMGGVKAKPVPWLWPHRIPRGMLTIIAGPPGVGKTFVSLYIAGRITTGGIWPDIGKEAPMGTVILLSAEDSKEYTIKKRLDLLGADAYKIEKIEMVQPDQLGKGRTFSLADDIARLEVMAKKTDAKLIIVDPVNSYLGGKQDGFKDTEVRRVLDPLKEMAERLDIAVVLLMHTKKGIEEEILYQIGGSSPSRPSSGPSSSARVIPRHRGASSSPTPRCWRSRGPRCPTPSRVRPVWCGAPTRSSSRRARSSRPSTSRGRSRPRERMHISGCCRSWPMGRSRPQTRGRTRPSTCSRRRP
jgi:hypothetical protein